MSENIVNIAIEHIHPHPQNPRKDLGDLTEMAESVKKKGIMQNLTVMPIEGETGEYMLLIGHRRHGASLAAGLKELPCRIIEGLSENDQVSIMMEENMQRNDLTIVEQAQGFQMMLDLGDTEDTIAEKTGFSKQTIKHRLNIAKLDQDILKKKQSDDGFQMSIKDLYALESIKDVEVRNKILSEAEDSRQLIWKARNAVEEAKREKNKKAILKFLEEAGVEKAPDRYASERYYGDKWKEVERISTEENPPEEIVLKEKEKVYYYIDFRSILLVKAMKKKPKSKEEIEKDEQNKRKKELIAKMNELDIVKTEFIKNIVNGNIEKSTSDGTKNMIWQSIVELGTRIYKDSMIHFITGKYSYNMTNQEKEEAKKEIGKLDVVSQMLIFLNNAMYESRELVEYQGYYDKEKAEKLDNAYLILQTFGWTFTEEQRKIIYGAHELYKKPNGRSNE